MLFWNKIHRFYLNCIRCVIITSRGLTINFPIIFDIPKLSLVNAQQQKKMSKATKHNKRGWGRGKDRLRKVTVGKLSRTFALLSAPLGRLHLTYLSTKPTKIPRDECDNQKLRTQILFLKCLQFLCRRSYKNGARYSTWRVKISLMKNDLFVLINSNIFADLVRIIRQKWYLNPQV